MSLNKAVGIIVASILLALGSLNSVHADARDASMPAIYASIDKQFGKYRGSYLYPNGRINDQLNTALNLPRDTVYLENGNRIVNGCRRHSCPEKTAVIVSPNNIVLAAGLINYDTEIEDFSDHPILTIFSTKKYDDPALGLELELFFKKMFQEEKERDLRGIEGLEPPFVWTSALQNMRDPIVEKVVFP